MRSRALAAVSALVIAAVGGVFLFGHLSDPAVGELRTNTQSSESERGDADGVGRRDATSGPGPRPFGRAGGSDETRRLASPLTDTAPSDDPRELPYFSGDPTSPTRDLERWFHDRAGGPLDDVPSAPVPVRWGRGCEVPRARFSERGHDREAGAFLGALGFRTRERFPRGVKLEDFAQFWTEGARFFQLAAVWNANEPPTYGLELWESQEPRLGDTSRARPIAGVSSDTPLDVEDVYAVATRLVSEAESRGGRRGARIALVSVTGRSLTRADAARIEHRVEFFDGIPREVATSGIACRYVRDVRALACACFASEYEP